MWRDTWIFLVAIFCFSLTPETRAAGCGYEACPAIDSSKLNIHLIPHSHDDVGYLKTFDQTYFGGRNEISNVGVQYILDSVVDALLENEDRKFVFAETAFFWKWWQEQSEQTQLNVKTLVEDGRLQFVGGGWSQNDEATTNYFSIIDQFSHGLRKLTDTFGTCGRPSVGWQIDTYGHSREMASIFSQMGFDGEFVGRIDYQDMEKRMSEKNMEFVWESSPKNLGKSAELFTHVFSDFYDPPSGFCYDIVLCDMESFVDDKQSPDYNVLVKIRSFLAYAQEYRTYYNTSNVMIPMGGDFYYQDAPAYFKNIDKLIQYLTQEYKYTTNIVYSTPACYLKAVNDANVEFTSVQDDFFPYADVLKSYWTGFYTSRPTNKLFERMGNNLLQVTKQLMAVTQLGQSETETSPLESLKEAMGIMQHHHAITGTEKQNVADDYMRILTNGAEDARVAASAALNSLLARGAETVDFQHCLELNVSKCAFTENKQFVVTVYNPLSHAINTTVRFPIIQGTYLVQDREGEGQTYQVVPIPDTIIRMPEREGSLAYYDLVFRAIDVPALGLKSYHVNRISTDFETPVYTDETSIGDPATLEVITNATSGLVTTIVSKGIEIDVSQNFYYYEALNGNNVERGNRSSGPYVFHPTSDTPTPIVTEKVQQYEVYKGEVVDEIHQIFNTWVKQVIRIYKGEDHVEFDWIVGPVPIDDEVGKEVVSRFTTDFNTDGLFYTDSNGREMLERQINHRATWDLVDNEPVAGNYYPVTSRIVLKDDSLAQRFAVFTDRAQGGSSLSDGQVELMIQRRHVTEDGLGVDEVLNEEAFGAGVIIRGQHYVMTGSNDFVAEERELAQKKLLAPWLFFTVTEHSYGEWSGAFNMEYSGLTGDLPPNVLLHTLEPWGTGSLLLRLEHILESDDDADLSQAVTVEFEDIFTSFDVSGYQQTTLDGNLPLTEVNRMAWNSASTSPEVTQEENTLSPMQISTYVLTVAAKAEE